MCQRNPLSHIGICVAQITLVLASLASAETVRFATFNVSLYDKSPGRLAQRLATRDDVQARTIAEIIQRVRPDVLLLNEFDYEPHDSAIQDFLTNYLAVGQHVSQSPDGPAQPIEYAHRFRAASNTGVSSGFDLDRDGTAQQTPGDSQYGGDCWGYGEYPGKYAMVLLSQYPIDSKAVRTFQRFRWRDMPAARLPDDLETAAPRDWYSGKILEQFPLSSKSHWDVPIRITGQTLHVLASHPTPPTYDGPEDRNGRRNHDEIRFWVDYIDPDSSGYIYDDQGQRGGLPLGEKFVVMGDLNGDPADGDGAEGIQRLLNSPHVNPIPIPESAGGAEQARLQGGANATHVGKPKYDTLDAADADGPGNLRVDYVIPATSLTTLASGVFWPENKKRLFSLVGTYPFPSSDHRLVWIDIVLPVVSGQ